MKKIVCWQNWIRIFYFQTAASCWQSRTSGADSGRTVVPGTPTLAAGTSPLPLLPALSPFCFCTQVIRASVETGSGWCEAEGKEAGSRHSEQKDSKRTKKVKGSPGNLLFLSRKKAMLYRYMRESGRISKLNPWFPSL